jgi:uncharacterized membrane protein
MKWDDLAAQPCSVARTAAVIGDRWTLLILPIGVIAARRHMVVAHRKTMMGLFYGGFAINLIIAFLPGRLLWNLFF